MLPAEDAADRVGDVVGVESGGRHLVQQRLERVEVVLVDHDHLDIDVAKPAHDTKTAESGADDDDAMAFGHGFLPDGGEGTVARTVPAIGYLDSSSYAPTPQTDCPAIADPLAGLPAPAVGACTFTKYKVTSGSQSLTPGVYCGGIEVGSNAAVNLLPGTYVIKDGSLSVKSNATLSGNDVTLYLTGSGATIEVKADSTISLTAPSTGTYAGVLMFEDRNAPLHQTHKFESRNAPNLLGTIYLSRGDLQVGVKGSGGSGGVAVGATSAWTIIVARTLSVTDNQTLQLNTNYGATTVPPPDGVGPHVANAQLVQ